MMAITVLCSDTRNGRASDLSVRVGELDVPEALAK